MKKTILITGSTDGIGKLSAIELAKAGHEVYLHGRNQDKLNATIEEVKTASGNTNVKGFEADFSNLNDVRKMAQEITEELPQLDVLINNAGIYNSSSSHNSEGLELRMVVNYLAPYLLTTGLLPLLQKGNDPRIINLSSTAQSPVSLEALKGNESISERDAYAQSKLALTMWSFHLAKTQTDISTIAVNPGSLLNTKMVREAFGNSWSSADKGAHILTDLALSDELKDVTGKYFDNDQGSFGRAHPDAYNQEAIKKLIKVTDETVFS